MLVLEQITDNEQAIPYKLAFCLARILKEAGTPPFYSYKRNIKTLSKILWHISQRSSAMPEGLVDIADEKMLKGMVNEFLI